MAVSLTQNGPTVNGNKISSKTATQVLSTLNYFPCVAVLTWQQDEKLKNNWVVIFCDNMAVVNMINKTTSGCKNCMYLLRILIFNCMINNLRIFAKFVQSKENGLADALSRMQLKRFRQLAKDQNRQMNEYPHTKDSRVWPLSKIWNKHN